LAHLDTGTTASKEKETKTKRGSTRDEVKGAKSRKQCVDEDDMSQANAKLEARNAKSKPQSLATESQEGVREGSDERSPMLMSMLPGTPEVSPEEVYEDLGSGICRSENVRSYQSTHLFEATHLEDAPAIHTDFPSMPFDGQTHQV
jgi:hypothetical protein